MPPYLALAWAIALVVAFWFGITAALNDARLDAYRDRLAPTVTVD